MPAPQRDRALLTGWTRKEAYLKGLGPTQAPPADRVVVSMRPAEPPWLQAAGARDWTLADVDAGPEYAAAVAVGTPGAVVRCLDCDPAWLIREADHSLLD